MDLETCFLILFQLEMVVPIKFTASSVVIKKESPYTRFLNHQISKLRTSGIMQELLEKHATRKPLCQTKEKSKSIHFQKVIFPFFVYMIGVISALAIFFIEKSITHRNENVQTDKESVVCQDILGMSFSSQENYSKTIEVGVQYDPFLESAAKLHRRISI